MESLWKPLCMYIFQVFIVTYVLMLVKSVAKAVNGLMEKQRCGIKAGTVCAGSFLFFTLLNTVTCVLLSFEDLVVYHRRQSWKVNQ